MARIGKYSIGERIGAGGMAEVFQGSVIGTQGFARPVAIKRMSRKMSEKDPDGTILCHEARVMASLRHPNIVAVSDFQRDEAGGLFLVMELVEGVALRKLASKGPVPLSVAIYIAIEILRGLAYVHDLKDEDGNPLGLIHHDLSGGNVLLSWDGAVKISDFGLAKAYGPDSEGDSQAYGTPAYMAPEQVRGLPLDARADLFAVGALLYELLTGVTPWVGENAMAVMSRILLDSLAPPREARPEIPADLEAIVLQLLEHDPENRPRSASAVIHALEQCSNASLRARSELVDLLRERFTADAAPPERRPEAPPEPGRADLAPADKARDSEAPPELDRPADEAATEADPETRRVTVRKSGPDEVIRRILGAEPAADAPDRDAKQSDSDAKQVTARMQRGAERAELAEPGADAAELAEPGANAAGLAKAGADTAGLAEPGADAVSLAEAGADAAGLAEAGADAAGLAEAGADAAELAEAGADAVSLAEAGADAAELAEAGADAVSLAEAGADAAELAEAGAQRAELAERGADLVAEPMNMHYELGREIGAGGMARVYAATREIAGRQHTYAIKVLHEELLENKDARRLFHQELRVGLDVGGSSPNLVTVYDVTDVNGCPAIVMEMIEGRTIAHALAAGRITYGLVRHVARDTLAALAHLHAAGYIHRDVKPENMLLAGDRIVLCDLGLVMAIGRRSKCYRGTEEHSHPDALAARSASPAWDLWSLGSTLFELLTGRLPAKDEPVSLPGSTPDDLRDLVAGLLRSEPRWTAAEALGLIAPEQTYEALRLARALPERRRTRARPRRRSWPLLAALAVCLAGAGGALWSMRSDATLTVEPVTVEPVCSDASVASDAPASMSVVAPVQASDPPSPDSPKWPPPTSARPARSQSIATVDLPW